MATRRVRRKVLISVMRDVHMVMGSDEGAEVFVALLRAAERAGQVAELSDIVRAAASRNRPRFFLTSVAGRVFRETALRELFRVAARARDPRLHEPLGACLIDKWTVEHLAQTCFTISSPRWPCLTSNCSIFIRQFAIPCFREMVMSELGYKCMLECLMYAGYDDLANLEQTILECTSEIARSQYGSRFLQKVIKGDHRWYRFELRDGIRKRVLMDLAQFSMDKFGNYVVRAFSDSRSHLTEMLDAFGNQRFADLYMHMLVRDRYAFHVIRRLLEAVEDTVHPGVRKRAVNLARRIQWLKDQYGQNAMYEADMRVVQRVLARAGPED